MIRWNNIVNKNGNTNPNQSYEVDKGTEENKQHLTRLKYDPHVLHRSFFNPSLASHLC